MKATAAAAQSLRHVVTIDHINNLIHDNKVLLMVAAIEAEPNNAARPKPAPTKTYDTTGFLDAGAWNILLDLDCWRVARIFLLISCLGPNLRIEGPIKGLP